MKLVLVEWIDSHSGRGWQSLEDIKETAKPLQCKSVGWLLAENDDCLILVPHIYDERNEGIILQGSGDITIPKTAIIQRVEIEK